MVGAEIDRRQPLLGPLDQAPQATQQPYPGGPGAMGLLEHLAALAHRHGPGLGHQAGRAAQGRRRAQLATGYRNESQGSDHR